MRALLLVASIVVSVMTTATVSEASTVTIVFTGEVEQAFDATGNLAYRVGSEITGTLTVEPIDNKPHPKTSNKTHFSGDAAFTSDPFSHAGTATIETLISSSHDAHFGVQFAAPPQQVDPSSPAFLPSFLTLDFNASNSSAIPLISLADLPADLAGIIAYIGGNPGISHGSLGGGPDDKSLAEYDFILKSLTISTIVTPTPISSTFHLFVSALGVLGIMGWYGRKNAHDKFAAAAIVA